MKLNKIIALLILVLSFQAIHSNLDKFSSYVRTESENISQLIEDLESGSDSNENFLGKVVPIDMPGFCRKVIVKFIIQN